MKLGSMTKMLAGVTLALTMSGGVVLAGPAPQSDSASQDSQDKALYPNATREEPELDLQSQETADQLNKGLNAVNAGQAATAKKILTPYANGSKGDSQYAQALALQGLANLAYRAGNLDAAIAKLQKALEIGVIPNDTYFQLMYQLGQFYAADKQNQQALATLKKWREQGRRQTAGSYGLEGILNYRMGNYKAAITAIQKAQSMTDKSKTTWNQVLAASYAETGQGSKGIAMAKKQLAANPNDATTRHNLIVLLMHAGKYDEALAAMEKARSQGQLTTSQSYVNLAKLYLIKGQNSGKDPKPFAEKALAVLDEGSQKGVIKPSYDYYKLRGDAALIGGDRDAALKAYTEAAPLGEKGAASLHRSELLAADNQPSASIDAAREALSKGTEHKGRAYMLIAKAERSMDNKADAVKAMKKAAKYPETSSAAKSWLQEAGY